jgi:hypothetical protein
MSAPPTLDLVARHDLPDLLHQIATLDSAEMPALLCAFAARMAEARRATPTVIDADLVDVHEAARLLGVSRSWLNHRPELPFRRKLGGKVKYSRSGLARWRQRDHAGGQP